MENFTTADEALSAVTRWWSTQLIEIKPGQITLHGRPIEELIGTTGFAGMIWFMLKGSLPGAAEERLLNAALVASVDHGPQAPSIAIARMAATCGVGINNAMASGINALGDIHGGAGQQCLAFYQSFLDPDSRRPVGEDLVSRVEAEVRAAIAARRPVPGFGHRFHPVDPRTGPLLSLVEKAVAEGAVEGRFMAVGRTVEAALAAVKGKHLPMNIDGVTAVIFGELGFDPQTARGLFILSRSVGILCHAREQMSQGGRIKGPMPPGIPYNYTGPARGRQDGDA
ncbi:citryl-CoA lyase [Microvirga sp. 2TAF3]|uniref:citryl-CoA lyase n=1 Tax=Microvirga sp. 2TAF3 TaxID=3233014 RepID=UPI003F9D381A